MRQGQNSKRPRGRGNSRRNVPARHQTFDSNGPSVRIRGRAFQVHEKYLAMARDAGTSGDRVAAENFLQHAEHYFRIINIDNENSAKSRSQANGAGDRAGGGERNQGNGRDGGGRQEQKAEATEPQPPESAAEPTAEMEQPEVTVTVPVVAPAPTGEAPDDEAPDTDKKSDD